MKTPDARELALELAQLAPGERNELLAELPDERRAELVRLIDEAERLMPRGAVGRGMERLGPLRSDPARPSRSGPLSFEAELSQLELHDAGTASPDDSAGASRLASRTDATHAGTRAGWQLSGTGATNAMTRESGQVGGTGAARAMTRASWQVGGVDATHAATHAGWRVGRTDTTHTLVPAALGRMSEGQLRALLSAESLAVQTRLISAIRTGELHRLPPAVRAAVLAHLANRCATHDVPLAAPINAWDRLASLWRRRT